MPTAGEQSGDRQRREKGPPILTAEKGELGARAIASEILPIRVRDITSPAGKMGNQGLFPGG